MINLPEIERDQLRQRQFFAFSLMVAAPVVLLFAIKHIRSGELSQGLVDIALTVVLLSVCLRLESLLKNLIIRRALAAVFVCYLGYHAALGSGNGASALWALLFPFLSCYLLGFREGLRWSLAFIVAVMSLMASSLVHAYEMDFLIRYGAVLLIMTLLAFGLEYKRALLASDFVGAIERHRASEQALKEALDEKGRLLREIHHRVKNNLSILQSLLSLKCRELELNDTVSRDALVDSQNRIMAMGLIHDHLYMKGQSASINIRHYLSDLVGKVHASFSEDGRRVGIATEIDEIFMDVELVIPLGLIVNELMTNSYRHALGGKDSGMLTVRLKEDGGLVRLEVEDDGVGLSPGFSVGAQSGLGLRVVRELASKLGGRIEASSMGGGACFSISFMNELAF